MSVSGLVFDPALHRYTLDGTPVPSVTGVLKRSGLIDFSGIPEAILEAARFRGTVVHQALHYWNEGDLDFDQFRRDFPDYVGYVEGWHSFCAQRSFTAVLNEHRVASRIHHVSGTFDALGVLDGEGALIDFATGRPEDAAKDLQTAAYLYLAREWADEPEGDPRLRQFLGAHQVVRRYAVALHRNGTFTLHPYAAPTDFRDFLTLVDAQRIVAARRGAAPLAEVA